MNNNISILDKKNCTGCRMCEQICPVQAIEIKENKEGFLEPVVNENKCIKCGLCTKRCPQINDILIKRLEMVEFYAAKNKNECEQKQSSSGGVFSSLANYIIEHNGIVYGCGFNENIEAEHIGIEKQEELNKLRGSKYVQSNTKNTYTKVKNELENGRLVLYSGTPCQIAGLRAFLKKDYNNLITIDLVCHGVPSPKLFKKYKEWLEEKNKSRILKYEFRNKEKNDWGEKGKITYENKIVYINSQLDPYYKSFLENKISREVCYKCKYANLQRIGDFTIGDFWGIEKEHSEFVDKYGISVLIVNTLKGKEVLKEIQDKLEKIVSNEEKAKRYNVNLNHPSIRPKIRNNIYSNLENKAFSRYIHEDLKFRRNIKDIIKQMVPNNIKRKLKKIKLKKIK